MVGIIILPLVAPLEPVFVRASVSRLFRDHEAGFGKLNEIPAKAPRRTPDYLSKGFLARPAPAPFTLKVIKRHV